MAGPISFSAEGPLVEELSDADLETLRKVALLVDLSKVVALFSGKGPDYSCELARLLAHGERKVLLVRCDFKGKFSDREAPGLLQALSGAPLLIRKEQGFDLLPCGGYTRHGTELLRSKAFDALLETLQKEYDHILLYDASALASTQVAALLAKCDKAAVTIAEEPIELLTPFARWAYHQGHCRLTFLTSVHEKL